MNIFAFRSTDPRGLLSVEDPIGPENDAAIDRAIGESAYVVAAWGLTPSRLRARGRVVFARIHGARPIHVLGWTKDGAPRHPLYVAAATQPIEARA